MSLSQTGGFFPRYSGFLSGYSGFLPQRMQTSVPINKV